MSELQFPAAFPFTLTEEELLLAFQRTHSRYKTGKDGRMKIRGKTIVQAVLLALVGVYALVPFFFSEEKQGASLFIGVCAFALAAAVCLLPRWQLRRDARAEAAQAVQRQVVLREEGLSFGAQEGAEVYAYERCRAEKFEDMLLFRFDAGQLFCLPRRALDDAYWNFLLTRIG